METRMELKSGYILVTELQRGDTVINLGIISQIFPHKEANETWIKFAPARCSNPVMMKYKNTDKLKTA
jgi:hypothetical protein